MTAEQLLEPVLIQQTEGGTVRLRPVRPDDAPRLQDFHARLSPESIYLRWLAAHPILTNAEAEALANVDYVTTMAFVATREHHGDEFIIGVARYTVADPEKPGEAEAAVVVEDPYQHRGVGSALLKRLIQYSLARGIRTWVAEINAENARMMRFVQLGGFPVTQRLEGGAWQMRMDITPAAQILQASDRQDAQP